ncbi:hypothetical protein FisN_22Lh111 [Fistulifera solaris]|uniref:DUF6824 domain-containing protein n=1 Tax=Fistulifera solaris TaxID=1519565 RepID=A0A1Z5JBV1_FISSO|nr:hypothetical protein FisN_22Lh111 [Fistulifera solaris]|eukprot:GAX11426.1 hypothetical protein FisN_22Lh111 [Fistulifera solaris]
MNASIDTMNHSIDFDSHPNMTEHEEMKALPASFKPGNRDVICARGHKAFNHPGNQHFRSLIESYIHEYEKAVTKLDKSAIVSKVVEDIRSASPDGGFVKIEGGRWFEVGDHNAREKTGQNFRNLLHLKYKSSTKSKTIRRQKSQQMMAEVRRVSAESLAGVSGGLYNEPSVNSHFDQVNQILLGQIKSNSSSAVGRMPQLAHLSYGSRFAPLFQQYFTGTPLTVQRVAQLNGTMNLNSCNTQPQQSEAPQNIPLPAFESLQSDFSRSMLADFLDSELGPIDDIFDEDGEQAVVPIKTTSNKKVHDLINMP